MNTRTMLQKEDILLKSSGMSDADITHSTQVAEKALEIAGRIRSGSGT